MKRRIGNLLTRSAAPAARLVMIVMAALVVLAGATMLTTPLAIPLVVGLWLGAAAMLFLGIWGRLPHVA